MLLTHNNITNQEVFGINSKYFLFFVRINIITIKIGLY